MSAEFSPYTQEGEWARSPERQQNRVVVTGIGLVTPLGISATETWNNMVQGKNGISEFDMAEIAHKSGMPHLAEVNAQVKVAGMIPEYSAKDILKSRLPEDIYKRAKLRRYSKAIEMGVMSAAEALSQAGLLDPESIEDRKRFGVRIGTSIGGVDNIARLSEELRNGKKQLSPIEPLLAGLERSSTAVSMVFEAKGPVETPTAACATGSLAIIDAYQDILSGDADIMLAGGVDYSIDPIAIRMFQDAGALTIDPDPEHASRPFDQDRSGFVMSSGAGVLVLERESHALARNAKILGEFAGYGRVSDAYSDTDPSGEGARESLRQAIRRSGLPDKGTFYFNAHGTSTKIGDEKEAEALTEVFSELPNNHPIAVSSTKSEIGHTMGASGAIEAITALQALNEGIMPPTIHLEKPLEEGKELNLIPNEAQEPADGVGLAASGNYGFGGVGSVLAFKKYYPR